MSSRRLEERNESDNTGQHADDGLVAVGSTSELAWGSSGGSARGSAGGGYRRNWDGAGGAAKSRRGRDGVTVGLRLGLAIRDLANDTVG